MPDAAPLRIAAYADKLSVRPGERIACMVSCEDPSFRTRVLRLVHGDENPRGPGFKADVVPSDVAGVHPGRVQPLTPGSYVVIADPPPLREATTLTFTAWIWPTLPEAGDQAIVTRYDAEDRGFGLFLTDSGAVELIAEGPGGATRVRNPGRLAARRWSFVACSVDPTAGDARLFVRADGVPWHGEGRSGSAAGDSPLVIAARRRPGVAADRHFNGKVDSPQLFARMLTASDLATLAEGKPVTGALADWDLSRDLGTTLVRDVSGIELHGRTVNRPTRGVTGRAWIGEETDPRLAPTEYAAIHFHDDDLDDAGWSQDFEWTIPRELPSGVYAFELTTDDGGSYHCPFFVAPARGTATAKIALLVPVFSYLAYANEHMLDNPIYGGSRPVGSPIDAWSEAADAYIAAHRLHSCYDRHRDGSGVCHSSRRRPIPTLSPLYRAKGREARRPHQLAADLYLVDWLHEQGHEFDVITDDSLHAEGAALLKPYDVVLLGTHAEYVSGQILDALEAHVTAGGTLINPGGNAHYWVTGLDRESGHTVEVRRWGPATRTWDAEPGEWHLSTTGELGGLWRFRGRPPQRLLGAGSTAAGSGGNRPYRRTAASFGPALAALFDGIGAAELLGDVPSLFEDRQGAAGFETDRADPVLGTPADTIVLASATGFSHSYRPLVDDLLQFPAAGEIDGGLVRADLVLRLTPAGGAVFSSGAITWAYSLSHDGYDNDVSKLLQNLLDIALRGGWTEIVELETRSGDRGA